MNNKTTIIFLIILSMMSMSGLIATDIFLPAIPSMVDNLNLTSVQAQSLISVYLVGISVMQLVYGPISDSFGRKPILIIGLIVFILFSFAITLFNSYSYIITTRLFQSIGACVGLTLGRAIIGDLFNKEDAGKIFLMVFPFVGMTPAIAPVIGGFLNNIFNWRACFYFTSFFAFILLILVTFFFKETKPVAKRTKLHFLTIVSNYFLVVKNKKFWMYSFCVSFSYLAYFTYISESPFLLLKQGLNIKVLGFSFISLSITYVVGNIFARQLLKLFSLDKTLTIGYFTFVIGGSLFFISLYFMPKEFLLSIASISILTLGNGFLIPLGTAGGITIIPKLAGTASGMLGSLQLVSGAIGAQIIGILSNHNPFKIGIVLLIIVWCGFMIHVIPNIKKAFKRLSVRLRYE